VRHEEIGWDGIEVRSMGGLERSNEQFRCTWSNSNCLLAFKVREERDFSPGCIFNALHGKLINATLWRA